MFGIKSVVIGLALSALALLVGNHFLEFSTLQESVSTLSDDKEKLSANIDVFNKNELMLVAQIEARDLEIYKVKTELKKERENYRQHLNSTQNLAISLQEKLAILNTKSLESKSEKNCINETVPDDLIRLLTSASDEARNDTTTENNQRDSVSKGTDTNLDVFTSRETDFTREYVSSSL